MLIFFAIPRGTHRVIGVLWSDRQPILDGGYMRDALRNLIWAYGPWLSGLLTSPFRTTAPLVDLTSMKLMVC